MGDFEISFDLGRMKKFLILGFLIAVFAFELNLTFSNPIAFGDEGFHVSTARYVGTESDFSRYTPLFGSEINPERFVRAPFWNLVEGSFYFLFGFSDLIIKFLVPFMSFLTGLAIYVFLKKLYSENVGILAAAVAVTIPSFVTYSVLFYTTVPYVFFFTLAFLTFLAAVKTGERKWWVLSGLFSGVSLFTNIAGLFMPILFIAMGFLHLVKNRNMRGLMEALKTYGLALIILGLVVSPWAVRNVGMFYVPDCQDVTKILQGTCPSGEAYQSETTNEFAGRTAGGGTEESVLNVGVANYLQFAYGFRDQNTWLNTIGLAFVPFSFLAGLVVIAKRREWADIALIVSVLIFAVVFYRVGGFVDGRAEDTARYFLSMVPLIGIAAGTYWASVKKDDHKFNGLIVISVIAVVFAMSFLSLNQKVTQMDGVKNFVPSFFEACDWIEENTPEDANLFSLNTYPTRYNCDRGAVWETPDKADILLSGNADIVKERLQANGIDYVFVQKFSLSTTPFGQSYPVSFVDLLKDNNQTFKKVYENGPTYGTQEFVSCINGGGCDPGNIVYQVLE